MVDVTGDHLPILSGGYGIDGSHEGMFAAYGAWHSRNCLLDFGLCYRSSEVHLREEMKRHRYRGILILLSLSSNDTTTIIGVHKYINVYVEAMWLRKTS